LLNRLGSSLIGLRSLRGQHMGSELDEIDFEKFIEEIKTIDTKNLIAMRDFHNKFNLIANELKQVAQKFDVDKQALDKMFITSKRKLEIDKIFKSIEEELVKRNVQES
jgi:hypothetical protein